MNKEQLITVANCDSTPICRHENINHL